MGRHKWLQWPWCSRLANEVNKAPIIVETPPADNATELQKALFNAIAPPATLEKPIRPWNGWNRRHTCTCNK